MIVATVDSGGLQYTKQCERIRKIMQTYQFERIYSQMEKEFGKMRRGEEEAYSMLLFPMESNVLKVHLKNPKSNSRRMREAVGLVLFDIKSRYTGEAYDLDSFRDEDNRKLEEALLMAFDPFTNEEIKNHPGISLDPEELHKYYKEPVICLLRIKESIDAWEKRAGADGYFLFVEEYMGSQIIGDEMDFTVMADVQ